MRRQVEKENKAQKRKEQKDKRKETSQALMIEGMVRRFEDMLYSPHFNTASKNKLLDNMVKAINKYRGIA